MVFGYFLVGCFFLLEFFVGLLCFCNYDSRFIDLYYNCCKTQLRLCSLYTKTHSDIHVTRVDFMLTDTPSLLIAQN